MAKNKIYIGTSGWSYDHWHKIFYPKNLSKPEWLRFYSGIFGTVEINASFYHQLSPATYKNWYQAVPKDFIFSVKISRFLTHVKKLNQPRESWQRFINNVRYLKEKLGPILIQLPPNFKVNAEKLEKLLEIIPIKYKLALEVRHQSWFDQEIFAVLKKHQAALVFANSGNWTGPHLLTAKFIYLRLHGSASRYSSNYGVKFLKSLAMKVKRWRRQNLEIYIYFNNDDRAYAVNNAKTLAEYLKINI